MIFENQININRLALVYFQFLYTVFFFLLCCLFSRCAIILLSEEMQIESIESPNAPDFGTNEMETNTKTIVYEMKNGGRVNVQ